MIEPEHWNNGHLHVLKGLS